MLNVHGLSFAYHKRLAPVLHGIDFSIAEGEIFGFLGPSGSGKCTTQKILINLLKGYDGGVTGLGCDLRQWKSDYYEQVGVSFELPNHYQKLTAVENLKLFQALYHTPTTDPFQLLACVGLEQDAHTRVAQFSKGMQMRLNFVRALLHQPKLLFLDEPTSGLDPVNARKVKEVILHYKRQGTTIFLTTHDMKVADELCDRVAFIVDGTLLALRVTPLSLERYLIYKLAAPVLISTVAVYIFVPLVGLVAHPYAPLLPIAFLAALTGPVFALLLASLAANKVQGLAVMKGLSLVLVAPMVAYFVPTPWRWLFGLSPTFWSIKAFWQLLAGESWRLTVMGGLCVNSAIFLLLVNDFKYELGRQSR